MTGISREIEPVLRRLLAQRPCVVLTGCRQTGKTWLARSVLPHATYVTLDLPSVAEQAEGSGQRFLEQHPAPCVIDEVQYAPALFRNLKVAIDRTRDRSGAYLLTGSQRFVLMKGVTESLAGRAAILELSPLSLAEIEAARGQRAEGDRLLEWMWQGAFPELHARDLDAAEFHASLIATYLERDVRSLLAVRNLRDFERFLRLLAVRAGSLLEIGALAADTGISVNTAKAWLGVLEASGVLLLTPPWFENIGKRLVKSPKVYFLDTGLLCALLSIESQRALAKTSLRGAVFENLVHAELVKSFTNRGARPRIHFYRDHAGVEVDFVIPEADRLHLIEVKYQERAALPKGFKQVASAVGDARIASRCVVTARRDSHERDGVVGRGPAGGAWPWEVER